jgi:hypothetical protein
MLLGNIQRIFLMVCRADWILEEIGILGFEDAEKHIFQTEMGPVSTVHSILRASKGPGNEAIVLATKFHNNGTK